VPSTKEDPVKRSFERSLANALSDACFANALSSACEERLSTAGRRGQSPHVFIDVRKPRLDPCPLAVRERLQGRVRHFGFCRWMFPRARLGPLEHPVPLRVVGTTAMLDLIESCLSKSPATAEGTQGQGSRTPSLDTPHRDCSRRRLRPNPDRFGHLLSRLPSSSRSGVTWGENDAANATRACKARAARGSCGARLPRRNRTCTNPRGLLSLAVRKRTGRRLSEQASCPVTTSSAFFTTQNTREGRSHEFRWPGPTTRENGEPLYCRGPQRPLTTSAFE